MRGKEKYCPGGGGERAAARIRGEDKNVAGYGRLKRERCYVKKFG